HAVVSVFPYNPTQLILWIEGRQGLIPPKETPTWVLFFRPPHAPTVSIRTIDSSLKDLLGLCDGTCTLTQIVSFLAPRYAATWELTEDETREECLRTLEQLYQEGIIMLIPRE